MIAFEHSVTADAQVGEGGAAGSGNAPPEIPIGGVREMRVEAAELSDFVTPNQNAGALDRTGDPIQRAVIQNAALVVAQNRRCPFPESPGFHEDRATEDGGRVRIERRDAVEFLVRSGKRHVIAVKNMYPWTFGNLEAMVEIGDKPDVSRLANDIRPAGPDVLRGLARIVLGGRVIHNDDLGVGDIVVLFQQGGQRARKYAAQLNVGIMMERRWPRRPIPAVAPTAMFGIREVIVAGGCLDQ